MHRLLPHLQRALQLRDRLQTAGLALRARAFDQVALPLLVLGPTGTVLAVNPAGERACRSGAIRLDRSGLLLRSATATMSAPCSCAGCPKPGCSQGSFPRSRQGVQGRASW